MKKANRLGLVVNLDKSNIVVFRNGGHIAWNEKWFYGQSLISAVNVYKYLGICLSTRLNFSHALKDMAARAKIIIINRFYIALFSALEQTHCARV